MKRKLFPLLFCYLSINFVYSASVDWRQIDEMVKDCGMTFEDAYEAIQGTFPTNAQALYEAAKAKSSQTNNTDLFESEEEDNDQAYSDFEGRDGESHLCVAQRELEEKRERNRNQIQFHLDGVVTGILNHSITNKNALAEKVKTLHALFQANPRALTEITDITLAALNGSLASVDNLTKHSVLRELLSILENFNFTRERIPDVADSVLEMLRRLNKDITIELERISKIPDINKQTFNTVLIEQFFKEQNELYINRYVALLLKTHSESFVINLLLRKASRELNPTLILECLSFAIRHTKWDNSQTQKKIKDLLLEKCRSEKNMKAVNAYKDFAVRFNPKSLGNFMRILLEKQKDASSPPETTNQIVMWFKDAIKMPPDELKERFALFCENETSLAQKELTESEQEFVALYFYPPPSDIFNAVADIDGNISEYRDYINAMSFARGMGHRYQKGTLLPADVVGHICSFIDDRFTGYMSGEIQKIAFAEIVFNQSKAFAREFEKKRHTDLLRQSIALFTRFANRPSATIECDMDDVSTGNTTRENYIEARSSFYRTFGRNHLFMSFDRWQQLKGKIKSVY